MDTQLERLTRNPLHVWACPHCGYRQNIGHLGWCWACIELHEPHAAMMIAMVLGAVMVQPREQEK